ncbi:hypothetical protein PWT90_07508 [Aphanocladium album]|nr:hypothetical protein PWT90_07508 [Aphanocladium album]
MPKLAADGHFWDPVLKLFDFTLAFEEIILQLVPSCLAIFISPLFITHYQNEPAYVRQSPLLWAKVITSAALAGCQALSLAFHAHLADFRTNITFAAASLELVAAISVGLMMYWEHKHAVRSSAFLALYLFLTACCDAVKSRTYFLRPGMETLGALAATAAALRSSLIVLEEICKKPLLIDENMRVISGPEATSGFFQRTFFIYLQPMLMTGFRQKLTTKDMGKLGIDFSSKALHLRLKKNLAKSKSPQSRYRLIYACILTWKWQLLVMIIPRLVNIAATFAQPYLLALVIDATEADSKDESSKFTTNMRAGILCATFLVFMVQTVAKTASAHFANGLVTQVRGGLVAEMMEKTHNLEEKNAKDPAVLTHTSSDIEAICIGLASCVDIPMTIVELSFGVYLLSRFIGVSCFFVLLPVIGSSICSFFVGLESGPLMAKWNKSIESRVSKTSQVLHQLSEIKMMGLGPIMRDMIHKLRVEEMRTSRPYRFWMTLLNMTTSFADIGTPVIVLAAAYFWHGFGHRMSAAQVFPTLAIVGLIQGPTVKSLQVYSELTGMIACFDRVQKFLELPQRKDSRAKYDPSTSPGSLEPESDHFLSTPEGGIEMSRQVAQSPRSVIQFSNASFGPFGMEEPLLTDVNLTLFRNSTIGVLGNTGSGKSTFFKSIMGETKITSGLVYTDQVNIAYCGASVWLRDMSIRDNIIGCLPFDQARYDLAIRSCQLEPDLSRLPGRDSYIVGTNGAKLSGGQRQRVSLARAVFSHCDITIIDDCLSSLDRQTAVTILNELCGKEGILRSAGSTVLLSTYLPESLEVIDQMITIDTDGHVKLDEDFTSGASHEKLKARLPSAATYHVSPEAEDEHASVNRSLPLGDSSVSSEHDDSMAQGNWRLYWMFIKSAGKFRCATVCALALLMSASELAPEIYLRIWTDSAPDDGSWFGWYAGMATAATLITAVTYWMLYTVLAVRAAIDLHEQMLDATMRATLAFLTSTKTGDLINRYSQDANFFSRTLPFYFYRTLYTFYSVIILVAIILSSATYMCALIPVIFLSIYFVQRFYLRTSRQMRHFDLEEKAPMYTYLNEIAAGVSYIQAFGWVQESLEMGYRLLDNSQQPFYLMLCIQQWLGLVLGILTTVVAVTLVAVVVMARTGASSSAVGLSFLSLLNIQRTMVLLVEAWTGSETSVACLARLKRFKEETPQELRPDSSEEPPTAWPGEGALKLTGVSSRYKPATDTHPILQDVSLSVNGGHKIGLFGRTGSGKSSLLLTLLGLLSTEGTVAIDSVNINHVDPDALRARIVTITQHPLQFDDTLRANLLPFEINEDVDCMDPEQRRQRGAKDAVLISLLVRLDLWRKVRDKGGLAAKLPDIGYSRGEIQLLSIARAIMRQQETGSRLVLVDEATGNLDPEREAATQEIMDEAFEDCTVVTIAHRLETIEHADRKIEMVGGKLVESSQPFLTVFGIFPERLPSQLCSCHNTGPLSGVSAALQLSPPNSLSRPLSQSAHNTMSSAATPQRRKRALSDSSVEIIEVRSCSKKKKTPTKKAEGPQEEKRLRAFRHAQPRAFDAVWERATTERFFVLKRERCDADECPQEEFELAGTTGNVYSVKIARQPVCNCPYALKGNQCKHTIYILHRVLKAPRNLVYQLALLGSELRQIYDNLPQTGARGEDDAENRKSVEGECAICYMDLDKEDKKTIVWCRAACGQNFHRVCFDTWARTCGARGVTCPLCRSPWKMQENADVVAAVDKGKGVESDGYINVASQLGISGIRAPTTAPGFGTIGKREWPTMAEDADGGSFVGSRSQCQELSFCIISRSLRSADDRPAAFGLEFGGKWAAEPPKATESGGQSR